MTRAKKQPSRLLPALGAAALTLALAGLALALDPTTVPEVQAFSPVVAPPQAPDGLPPPLQGVATKMGQRNWVNGQLVDLDSYYSGATLGELIDYYSSALSSAAAEGVKVRRVRIGAVTHLSVLGSDGVLRAVLLSPQEDGRVLVVPSVNRGQLTPGGEIARLGVPIPPEAQALSTMETEDAGRRAVTANYLDPRAVAEVASEMARTLPAAGLLPDRQPDVPISEEGSRLLRYRTERGERVRVGLHAIGPEATLVYILRSKDSTPKLH